MTTNNQPVMNKKQLIKTTLIALLIGVIVLVTAVLPAEYNIDPLRTGKLFGFSKLYMEDTSEESGQSNMQTVQLDIKKLKLEDIGSEASVPKPIEANNPPPAEQFTGQNDTISVLVRAGKGIEYKFKALKYGSIKYEWATSDNHIIYTDFHGEVKQDNPPKEEFFESYTIAYSNNMVGTLTAPFEGKHGWYFKNKNKEDVTVIIRLSGQYQLFDK
ncbi:MAG: hypothetical protein DRJ10_06055 [Bacteroidetes bacterium]|nr:MAG: hypothetical protein DRJ10_06055 [Bacteroidota bacterium]